MIVTINTTFLQIVNSIKELAYFNIFIKTSSNISSAGRWPVFYYICTQTDFENDLKPKFGSTQVMPDP